jgi:hypothetical protein
LHLHTSNAPTDPDTKRTQDANAKKSYKKWVIDLFCAYLLVNALTFLSEAGRNRHDIGHKDRIKICGMLGRELAWQLTGPGE